MALHDIQTSLSDSTDKESKGGSSHSYLSCSSQDDDTQFQHDSSKVHGWKRQIVGQLSRILNGLKSPQGNKTYSYQRWSAMVLALTASAILYHRRGIPAWLLHFVSFQHDKKNTRLRNSKSSQASIVWKQVYSIMVPLLVLMKRPDYSKATEASLGLLRTAAQHGIVRKALIGPHSIVFATQEGWRKTMLPPNSAGLQSDLMEMLSQGGCSDISTLPESLGSKMVTPLLTALPFVYLALVYKMLKGIHNGSMDGGDFFSSKLLTGGGAQSAPRASTTMFVDVAGLDDVLPEIRDVVTYLQHPSGYHALGAEPPRGILLHGNPGNGKTLLAKAVAGEADCDAFVSCSGSEFVEMYVGRGAARIRSLFQEARKVAARNHAEKFGYGGRRYGRWLSNISDSFKLSRELVQKVERPPTAIIFIDELDALAKSRSSGLMSSNDERDQTLNQLLTEMDGFCSRSSCRNNNDFCSLVTIIVIAATNRPEVLDPAILRRFDRQIFVHAPNSNGRQAILKIHAAKTNCRFSTIHWEYLADQTHSFSGSDLKQVVNDAALLAVRQKNKYVEQGHLIQAIQRAKATKVQRFGRGTSPASGLDGSNRENEPPLLHPFLWNGR